MKDFDLTEIRAARNMEEANFRFKKEGIVACRQEIGGGFKERVKAVFSKIVMKEEGRL